MYHVVAADDARRLCYSNVMATAPTMSRTDWAEGEVEDILSLPLISEFVFRSPKHNDPNEKEVIDHLIVHKDEAILISQKAQDDPTKRSVQRNELWVLKNTQDALKPILGAIGKPTTAQSGASTRAGAESYFTRSRRLFMVLL